MRVPLAGGGRGLLAAWLLTVVASCSSEGSRSAEPGRQENAVAGAPAAQARTARPDSAKSATQSSVANAMASPAAGAQQGERRCGWLSNPTPAAWWLTDRDGQWILATQGADQAPGMDEMPDMTTAGWVETNGHYGYGCACITIAHDPASGRVTRIANAEPKPLRQCQADKALPRPE